MSKNKAEVLVKGKNTMFEVPSNFVKEKTMNWYEERILFCHEYMILHLIH